MATIVYAGQSSEVYGPWVYEWKWSGSVLTYSFPDDASDFGYEPDAAVSQINAEQQDAARRALDQVSSFTGLQFQETYGNQAANATLKFTQEAGEDAAYAYFPSNSEIGGDGFFGSGTTSTGIGTYGEFAFMHELGHMLGLDHGHEYAQFANSGFDSTEYTVMTYTNFLGDTSEYYTIGAVDGPQSYMQLDIAALQFLYGANYASSGEVWSGDSVYTFSTTTGEMFINGDGQGTPAGNRIFRTIWDGHGEDTYDLSNYATDLIIDLRPGEWSTFSDDQLADLDNTSSDPARIAQGNVANALLFEGDTRGLIENAIGGTGHDVLTGNQAANDLDGGKGHDVLNGRGGADVLSGGKGNDELSGGNGNDQLSGGNGDDSLGGDDGDDVIKGRNGNDNLRGGAGADVLVGGTGADVMRGNGGHDRFVFQSVDDSVAGEKYDRVIGFKSGADKLDYSGFETEFILAIDSGLKGQGPTLATRQKDGHTIVSVDIDGDGSADMKIIVKEVIGLTENDFLL